MSTCVDSQKSVSSLFTTTPLTALVMSANEKMCKKPHGFSASLRHSSAQTVEGSHQTLLHSRNSPLKKKVAKHMISERHSNSHPLKPWKGHTKVGQSDSADK